MRPIKKSAAHSQPSGTASADAPQLGGVGSDSFTVSRKRHPGDRGSPTGTGSVLVTRPVVSAISPMSRASTPLRRPTQGPALQRDRRVAQKESRPAALYLTLAFATAFVACVLLSYAVIAAVFGLLAGAALMHANGMIADWQDSKRFASDYPPALESGPTVSARKKGTIVNRIKQGLMMGIAARRLAPKRKTFDADETGPIFWLGAICVGGLLCFALTDVAVRVAMVLAEVPR